jgi:hypothetical protein
MRFLNKTLLAMILSIVPVAAKADYFVWQDPKSAMTASYPDTWRETVNQKPNDVFTVLLPAGRAHAQCRLRVEDEGRFKVYPVRFDSSIQRVAFSRDFWDQYLLEFTSPQIEAIADGAGLGRGFASYVIANYQSSVPGPNMNRRALIYASQYNNKLYIAECSAHADAFKDYEGFFRSFISTVEFRKEAHELTSGNYRPFLLDPHIEFIDIIGNQPTQFQ